MLSDRKDLKEVRIQGVNPKLDRELHNIADNLGITRNSFLKPKLKEIADSYSEEMKKPKSKD